MQESYLIAPLVLSFVCFSTLCSCAAVNWEWVPIVYQERRLRARRGGIATAAREKWMRQTMRAWRQAVLPRMRPNSWARRKRRNDETPLLIF